MNLLLTSLIFFPEKGFYETPDDYGLAYEDAFVKTEDGVKLHGWFLKAKPNGVRRPAIRGPDPNRVSDQNLTLLFFHGNAGNISGRVSKAKGWTDRGFSVFLIDYRGYGKSEGAIHHEEDVIKDARAAWNWLIEEKKIPEADIILYGESLGSYAATRLANFYKPKAIILEAPFTSFVDLGKLHYRGIPGIDFFLQDFQFHNENYIDKIKSPLFILHGTADETCPYEMGQKLFAKAPEPKQLFSIPDGFHNDLPSKAEEAYWDKPLQFLKGVRPKQA